LSAKGIVSCLEDHSSSDGSNRGGSQGVIFTGTLLQNELAAYQNYAQRYANNTYVWFGTTNEPSWEISPNVYNLAALSAWQGQIYDAIRNAGNNSIIEIEAPGGGDPNTMGTQFGLDASVYARMHTIIHGPHFYSWSTYINNDQNQNGQVVDVGQQNLQNDISNAIQLCQELTSQDGVVPVACLEYGPSTDGTTQDVSGNEQVNAVIAMTGSNPTANLCGFAAWIIQPGENDNLTDNSGNLTKPYGVTVAAAIATNQTYS
jgi:hypothetical protein